MAKKKKPALGIDSKTIEKNLIVHEEVSKEQAEEIQNMALTGAKQSSIAKTPAQQKVLDQANSVINSGIAEIEELFWGPNENATIAFVKGLGYKKEELPKINKQIVDTKPGNSIILKNKAYIKSADFKFELVEGYIYRLEKAVLAEVKNRKQKEFDLEQSENKLKDLKELDNLGFFDTISLAFYKLLKQ